MRPQACVGPDAVEAGRVYRVTLTTPGGLVRFQLGDLLRGASLREHTERAGLIAAAATRTLDETQAFLAERGFLLVLADPDGVVVSTRGGGAFADEARRLRLIEGACWSEAARGTNAIGTALTEARPLAVKGHAHYGRRFHELVCYAAPIIGPDGRVVGVLDATSTIDRVDDVVGFTVTAAARALEDVLRQDGKRDDGSAILDGSMVASCPVPAGHPLAGAAIALDGWWKACKLP